MGNGNSISNSNCTTTTTTATATATATTTTTNNNKFRRPWRRVPSQAPPEPASACRTSRSARGRTIACANFCQHLGPTQKGRVKRGMVVRSPIGDSPCGNW